MLLLSTIAEIHRQFALGALTPVTLLKQCWHNIEQFESSVHAWVMLDKTDAFHTAQTQTDWLKKHADTTTWPSLLGIPIGIKDIIDVATWPTKAGSKLREHHAAQSDAPLVSRLRAAGAILIGKTVTTEFACFDPATTRNPWNLNHTPGGSSSGSAAGVASHMCVAAIGSQTGGSILRPAAFCGVVGFKPAYGSIPLEQVVPVSAALDHVGPIAHSVADALQLYNVLSHEQNQLSPQLPKQIGIVNSFFVDKSQHEMALGFRSVLEKLSQLSISILNVEPPYSITEMHKVHRLLMAYECAIVHAQTVREHREKYSAGVLSLIEEGQKISVADYEQAKLNAEEATQAWQNCFSQVDLLIMPTTCGTAPATLASTGDPRWQSPWSLCGLPSITLPCGLSSNGLPLGLQLVAKSNAVILNYAACIENHLQFTFTPQFTASAI